MAKSKAAKTVDTNFFDQSGASAAKPIGVPAGYQAEKQVTPGLFGLGYIAAGTSSYQVPPKYFEGHQYGPAGALSTDEIIDLQERMVAAGLMKRGDYTVGVWDNASTNAYADLLGEANAAGVDETDALNRRIASYQAAPDQSAASGAKRAPKTITLTNPDDIRAMARNTARDLYGANLPEPELERFIGTYQNMEAQYQSDQYDQALSGGTTTQPPSAESALEEQIRREHPNEVAATQFGNLMGNVISTFTGGR